MPPDLTGSRSPFVLVSDTTLFTSTTSRVLDSVYFRSHFRVRSVPNGENAGSSLKSKPLLFSETGKTARRARINQKIYFILENGGILIMY